MKHTILITLPLKDRHVDKIRNSFPDAAIYFSPADHSVSMHHETCTVYLGFPDKTEIQSTPNLVFIQAGYAGVDALPDEAFSKNDLVIASAKGIHNTQMSELFFAMVLYFGRNMPAWNERNLQQRWDKQPVKETFLLGGKTLAIVGYGTIGKKIAMIAQTFDMRVIGIRSSVEAENRRSDPFTEEIVPVEEVGNTLAKSDIVLNLLPLTPATEKFFDERRFTAMKPGVMFVNLGRGATVVDNALIKAIDDGIVRYAALDVFRDEPLPEDHPFWLHPRILITPHIGGLMPDYWGTVVDLFIENLHRFEKGEELLNVVDKEKRY